MNAQEVRQSLTPVSHTANHAAGLELVVAIWLALALVSLASVIPPVWHALADVRAARAARRLGDPQPAPADPDPMPGARRAPVSGSRP